MMLIEFELDIQTMTEKEIQLGHQASFSEVNELNSRRLTIGKK